MEKGMPKEVSGKVFLLTLCMQLIGATLSATAPHPWRKHSSRDTVRSGHSSFGIPVPAWNYIWGIPDNHYRLGFVCSP